MIFCTYEDRPSCLIGLKILVRSLKRHLPEAKIRVWCPADDARFVEFIDWLQEQDNCLPFPGRPLAGTAWNVKPQVLLYELEQGACEAIWIDADIILGDDPAPFLKGDERILLATDGMRWDESPRGSNQRTIGLGRTVGRECPGIVSSSVVRATRAHVELLRAWADTLESADYTRWQREPFWDRPAHAAGDQDVLMGLLGSTEFADIPVRLIPTGKAIAHCFFSVGYTTGERLRNCFRGVPPFVHAPSPVKPWSDSVPVSVEVSPYPWVAAGYRTEIEDPMDWTRPRSWLGRLLHLIAFGEPNLRGLPLSVIRESQLHLQALRKRFRRPPGNRSDPADSDTFPQA